MNPEAIRDEILTIIDRHAPADGWYEASSVIASELGIDETDVQYHLQLLARDGLVSLIKQLGGGEMLAAGLTPSGRQRAREGNLVDTDPEAISRVDYPGDRRARKDEAVRVHGVCRSRRQARHH